MKAKGLFDDQKAADPLDFFPSFQGKKPAAAAEELAAWLQESIPAEVLERLPGAIAERLAGSFETDRSLGMLLDWWNGLAAEGVVSHSVRKFPLSLEIRRAWKACIQSKEIQELIQDLDRLEAEIRASSLCREGWFRLEKLIGGARNREGCLIVQKLIEGGYRTNGSSNGRDAEGGIQEFLRRHGSPHG